MVMTKKLLQHQHWDNIKHWGNYVYPYFVISTLIWLAVYMMKLDLTYMKLIIKMCIINLFY